MLNKTVAIIPARGGSKRILKKNIINFNGKPLIAWTIEAALESKVFDRIIVSTDCEEIAVVARQFGAEVPFLREEKADDYTPVSEATISTLDQMKKLKGVEFKTVVQLMANCPLRNSSDIIASFNSFQKSNSNFQISSFKFGWMNPWWAAKVDQKGIPNPIFKDALAKRSQDLEDLFCPTGAILIANTINLKDANTFYGENHTYCELEWTSAIDIDNEEDLKMAKAIYLLQNNIQE